MHSLYTYRQYAPTRPRGQAIRRLGVLLVALFAGSLGIQAVIGHAATASSELRSGFNGYCLEDKDNQDTHTTLENCNGTTTQNWYTTDKTIRHAATSCLTAKGDGIVSGTPIIVTACRDNPGQVWLRDRKGYLNPNSSLCLNVASGQPGTQVTLGSCAGIDQNNERWTPVPLTKPSKAIQPICSGSEGDKVACYATQEWTKWQSGTPTHSVLLDRYGDGNGTEPWCADFVSYVYKEAGYPFTHGDRDSWDEYDANRLAAMGFVEHDAASYTPKTGDVAYFDYGGGHAEIVVSGGKTPTFIYGDSATSDLETGNGTMATNTITSNDEGQLVYYLSPQ